MNDLNQDDAVERMLDQLEGLINFRQDDSPAPPRVDPPLDDSSPNRPPGDPAPQLDVERRPLAAQDGPRTKDLIGGQGEPEPPVSSVPEYDPDTTVPEMEPYDPDETLLEADVFDPGATQRETAESDPDATPREMDAVEPKSGEPEPIAPAPPPVMFEPQHSLAQDPEIEAEGPQPEPQLELPEQTGGAHMTRRLTTRLGQLLVDTERLSESQLQSALERQQETGQRLGELLVSEGYLDESTLLSVLESQYGVPAVALDDAELDTALAKLIPHDMAERYLLVPLALHADAVDVAMVDPTDFVAMAHLRFATGLRPNVFIATATAARRAIARLYAHEDRNAADQPADPREAVRRMILDRDSMLLFAADEDPRKFYELATSIEAFVDEIFRKVSG